jgi:hypothetical protein
MPDALSFSFVLNNLFPYAKPIAKHVNVYLSYDTVVKTGNVRYNSYAILSSPETPAFPVKVFRTLIVSGF